MKASNPASSNAPSRRPSSCRFFPPGFLPASSLPGMTQYDSAIGFGRLAIRIEETFEIEQAGIGQVSWLDVAQRREDRFCAAREIPLPGGKHLLHLAALRVLLRAAQLAGNDREAAGARITFDLRLGDIGQRADDDVTAVFGLELRRHGLEPPAEEQVQEQRLDDVVAMVPERDLRDAVFGRVAIQRTAAQP